jgi:hypothetical protein
VLLGGVLTDRWGRRPTLFSAHLAAAVSMLGLGLLPPSAFGTAIALNGVLIVLLQLPVARWVRDFRRSRVLAFAAVLTRARRLAVLRAVEAGASVRPRGGSPLTVEVPLPHPSDGAAQEANA